jgi:CubicO group peptidase (beta-lactamase class C family)
VRDLFTHTSGLVYGHSAAPFVKELYEAKGINFQNTQAGLDLAAMAERAAELPLVCHPGSAWNYGISTDILGRLVEVLAEKPLDRVLAERVTGPLGMADTAFHVPPEKAHRLAACYTREGETTVLSDAPAGSRFTRPPELFSGGGGMVGTIGDYDRFCRMLLAKGEAGGRRLLGRKTVEYMTQNHLPGDMAAMGQPRWSETTYEGIGFGLGFAVMLEPARAQVVGSPGEYHWGGVANTAFWIDPAEDMFVVLMTQVLPSSALGLRRQLRVLTYQAVVD